MREFPMYSFFSIPAEYVRTKKARKEKALVMGLVDENGIIRAEYKSQIKELFYQINSKLSLG